MSDVVEKTLTAIPSLLFLDSQPGAGKLSLTSKLGSLIRNITELTSKHEEEKLIKKELSAIREQASSPNTTLRQMKEIMVRAIYCEMLGYEASFSYIHAIKLAQQGSVLEKRVGYLAVSLFLNESHDLLLLLVNTVLKDLQSTNLIEVCMALTVASQIFPKDMIPAVLPLVEDKLTHSKEIIRRKAVLALYKFYLIAPNQVQHIHDKFRKALCDKDPGVMTASLHIYLQMIKENPGGFKDLTGSFITILRQVVGGKLPIDFNYHSVPAPWLQIQLLRVLALLGKDDPSASEIMYDVLDESLRRAEMNHNITYAILYECVRTVYTISPNSDLLEKAAQCIGKFVLSPKINLKYLGLKALTFVVQQDANLALQHQMTIIECLDHPDPIIRRETLELLYRITNAQNVTIIVEKMLDFLRQSKDEYTTINLVGKVAELAEKYPFLSSCNGWFIQTMNTVFSLGGDMMQPDIPNNFLRLLAEVFWTIGPLVFLPSSLFSEANHQMFVHDSTFLDCKNSQFVLGEYSYLKSETGYEVVLNKLARSLDQSSVTPETKGWIMAAITKLSSGTTCTKTASAVALKYSTSLDTVLRQCAFELRHLTEDRDLMSQVLPLDASCEDLEVDTSLSFLDGFVSEALASGAAPYKPHHQRQEELSQEKALNYEPYSLSLPVSLSSCSITGRQSPSGLSLSSGLSGNSAEMAQKGSSSTLKLEGVRKVWGKEGYLPQKEAPEESALKPLSKPARTPAQSPNMEGTTPQECRINEATPEQDQERQQLASSLFVGLGSHNSLCLMGKSEVASQRFRRKNKAQESPGADDKFSDSSVSSRSTVESLLDKILEPSPKAQDPGLVTPSHALRNSPDVKESTELGGVTGEGKPSAERPEHSKSRLSSHLPTELSELTRSVIEKVCSDERLTLSVCKIYREDSLVLVFFVENHSELSVMDVLLQLVPAELKELQIGFMKKMFSEVRRAHVYKSSSHHFPLLVPQSVEIFQTNVVMEEPCAQAPLAGTVSYHTEPGRSWELQFSVALVLSDFIRPLKVSTEEYGKLWLSCTHDVKQNLKLLSDQINSLVTPLNALKQKLQIHVVDIIGK
ncbi:AP4E1 protein, partial [Atractosteus spatula]|nr:AP4E1 protein [Atractosteus spatula]